MATDERPAKRIKTSGTEDQTSSTTNFDARQKSPSTSQGPSSGRKGQTRPAARNGKGQRAQEASHTTTRPERIRTFSQPSVISSGDKGIFVTCDKGREKKCLLELHDLLQQYLNDVGIDTMGNPTSENSAGAPGGPEDTAAGASTHDGIEADIASELAELRGTNSSTDDTKHVPPRPLQLITLDIPCVSFVRLPPGSSLDPVEIVHNLCLDAASPSQQRSRFVKRLTPISSLGKALSQGLEKVCDDVLPHYFGPRPDGTFKSVKFAIRPTIRNNDKLDREQVIKAVASKIQELGENQHKVDLKHYDKAVLVEVYRGWVGICVVDNTATGAYRMGYEDLKRFNLAEVYSSR